MFATQPWLQRYQPPALSPVQCPHIKTGPRGNNMKTLPLLILGLCLLSSLANGAPGIVDKLTNTLQSVAKNANQVNTALGCSTGNLYKRFMLSFWSTVYII